MLSPPGTTMISGGDEFSVVVGSVVDEDVVVGKEVDVVGSGSLEEPVCACVMMMMRCMCVCVHMCVYTTSELEEGVHN